MCFHMGVYTCIYGLYKDVCGGQRSTSGVFFDCASHYFFEIESGINWFD